MFTGIIEGLGKVVKIEKEQANVHLTMAAPLAGELKVDQSLAHNGVCLTVVDLQEGQYTVTAIQETMERTNLGTLELGDRVNLERAMQAHSRLDGHFVQGHVDQTAICTAIHEADGSWYFHFKYDNQTDQVLIEKGSLCINGVSLTLVEATDKSFSVAIIPYTYEHTNFHTFKVGTVVNIEFDMLGKYVTKLFKKHYIKV